MENLKNEVFTTLLDMDNAIVEAGAENSLFDSEGSERIARMYSCYSYEVDGVEYDIEFAETEEGVVITDVTEL